MDGMTDDLKFARNAVAILRTPERLQLLVVELTMFEGIAESESKRTEYSLVADVMDDVAMGEYGRALQKAKGDWEPPEEPDPWAITPRDRQLMEYEAKRRGR